MDAKDVNDLYDYGLKIVQGNNSFKYSIDSVLLSEFVKFDFKDKILLDMCTGNAPIPMILNDKIKEIVGIEIQKEIYELAKNSVEINNLANIQIINDDVKNIQNYFPGNNFDIITCNPPYFKSVASSVKNKNDTKSIARHEIMITLEDIIELSYLNLRNKGKFYLVHRSNRLSEILFLLEKYKFGIKRLQMVHNDDEADCSMILIESKKDSQSDIKILKPIILNKWRRDR